MARAKVSIVVALGKDRGIGKDGQLLWHIPEDLKRFKLLTMGHPVIMGRKTFESIVAVLGKALPGRTNIVVTRSSTLLGVDDPNVVIVHSLEEAIQKASEVDQKEIFVVGGAQIYEQALPLAYKMYLTLVDDEKESDAYFPPYEHLFTKKLSEEIREHDGLRYRWIDLET
ncbi:dihydrofolate reductase [Patescibacteria group bacterium]|nr:dihydrofolate reductase [Patescibacteria group bacterium]